MRGSYESGLLGVLEHMGVFLGPVSLADLRPHLKQGVTFLVLINPVWTPTMLDFGPDVLNPNHMGKSF